MPKQKRWTIKRHLDQATNNIDRAIDDLVIAGHEFKGVHDEYYQAFSMMVSNLNSIKAGINDLRDMI